MENQNCINPEAWCEECEFTDICYSRHRGEKIKPLIFDQENKQK